MLPQPRPPAPVEPAVDPQTRPCRTTCHTDAHAVPGHMCFAPPLHWPGGYNVNRFAARWGSSDLFFFVLIMAVFFVEDICRLILTFVSDSCKELSAVRLVCRSLWNEAAAHGKYLRVAHGVPWDKLPLLCRRQDTLDLRNMDDVDVSIVLRLLETHPFNIVALPTKVEGMVKAISMEDLHLCCEKSVDTGQTILRALLQAANPEGLRIHSWDLVPLVSTSTITKIFYNGKCDLWYSTANFVFKKFFDHWNSQQLLAFLYNAVVFDDVKVCEPFFSGTLPSAGPLPAEVLCGALQLSGGFTLKQLTLACPQVVRKTNVPDRILSSLHVSADLPYLLLGDLGHRFQVRLDSSRVACDAARLAVLWHAFLAAHPVEVQVGNGREVQPKDVASLRNTFPWKCFFYAANKLFTDLRQLAADSELLSFRWDAAAPLLKFADLIERCWEADSDSLSEQLRQLRSTWSAILLSCLESKNRFRTVISLVVTEMQARRVERKAFVDAIGHLPQETSDVEARWQHAIQQALEARLQWYHERLRSAFDRLWTPTLLDLKKGFEIVLYGSAAMEAHLQRVRLHNVPASLLSDRVTRCAWQTQ
eukprot:GGOE01006899.1.p1 GENE.GGOE01006899.1~~GGOE01006899.1.p1  ORF type:complete len:589 (-),score=123.30 GGOE01006899.1:1209-2975(-)